MWRGTNKKGKIGYKGNNCYKTFFLYLQNEKRQMQSMQTALNLHNVKLYSLYIYTVCSTKFKVSLNCNDILNPCCINDSEFIA